MTGKCSISDVTIYHNPRCGSSRKTLQLLRDRGIEPTVIEYLKTPPDAKTLGTLADMLGVEPIDMVRRKEEAFTNLNLADKANNRAAVLNAMAEHPILIERPIVVNGNSQKAAIGRPPEKVLEIL